MEDLAATIYYEGDNDFTFTFYSDAGKTTPLDLTTLGVEYILQESDIDTTNQVFKDKSSGITLEGGSNEVARVQVTAADIRPFVMLKDGVAAGTNGRKIFHQVQALESGRPVRSGQGVLTIKAGARKVVSASAEAITAQITIATYNVTTTATGT